MPARWRAPQARHRRGASTTFGALTGKDSSEVARRVPLVAASGKIAHWSAERMMMAPVSAWHEGARPFYAAYPEDRVLDEVYSTVADDLVKALETWGMAYPDPLISATPRELEDPRLSSMVVDGTRNGWSDGAIGDIQPDRTTRT